MSEQSLRANLPESSTLFYRARFEIFPDEDIYAEVWPQIIRVFQNWLEGKEGRREQYGQSNLYSHLTNDIVNYSSYFDVTYQDCYLSSVFAGGALLCECGISRLEARAIQGAGTKQVPQFWAFDYIERDSERAFRRWRTNVGVTSSTSGTYIVNVRVAIYDDATFMGQAPIPERNTPNFIPKILSIKNCVTLAGEIPLSHEPIPLCEGNFRGFMEDLGSATRVTPLVVVSAYWDGEQSRFDIDPRAFAEKLAGSALVYTLDQSEYGLRNLYRAAFCDPDSVAFQFRIPNGGVRVFLPQVDLTDKVDSTRHRFYTYSWLKSHDLGKVSDAICIGVSRLYQKRANEVIDLVDLQLQENKIKREYYAKQYQEITKERNRSAHSLAQNVASASQGDTEDENRALREENKLLWEELGKQENDAKFTQEYIGFLESSSSEEADSLQQRLKEAHEENGRLTSRNSQLEYDVSILRDTNEELCHEKRALERQLESWEGLDSFPSSPSEAVDLAESLYGNRMIFLEDAKKSAEDFEGDVNEVFRILRNIHHHLWSLLFCEEREKAINLETEFQNRSGSELSLRETKTTKRDPKLMHLRTREYRGQKINITPHVKGVSGKRSAQLRVHFYVDEANEMIIIGHCGGHLDTAGTRHIK